MMKGQSYKTRRAGVVYPLPQKNAARFQFKGTLASSSRYIKCDEVKIWVFLNCRKQFTVLIVLFLYSLKTKQKDELMNYLMVANLFVCLDNFICNSFGIQF